MIEETPESEAQINKNLIQQMAEALAGDQSLNLQRGDILVVNCDEHGYKLFDSLQTICEEKEVVIRLADNGIHRVTQELQQVRDILANYRNGNWINDDELKDFIQQRTDYIAGVDLYQGANKMIALRGFPGKVDYKEANIPKEIEDAYELSASKNRKVREGKDNVVIMMPTPKEAEELGMDYDEYVKKFMEAGGNHDWVEYYKAQQLLIERLNQGEEIEIYQFDEEAPEGWQEMNLKVKLKKKKEGKDTWANSTIRRNYPGGEVFTGPEIVNGRFCVHGLMDFDGILLRGIKFDIADNQVDLDSLDILVKEGEDKEAILKKVIEILSLDPGASKIGELGIGTNNLIVGPQINAVLREKKLGIHLALGYSYSEYNEKPYPDGSNINIDNGNISENHIDIATTHNRGLLLKLDGKVLMADGVFYGEDEKPDTRLAIISAIYA
ncbi:aminopeptidase [Candidatus Dojkabacteria bacterium]|jgi:aminopeptidase|uniref:Aminopeptidase n=1 Tax=Candidatus Dojkabacteria bacterium TaxID=2099670 RepID=A0A955I7S8_9BACT|nr:aminopeptidase [Candidatus Dojkabacteria bacterium]